MSALGDGSARCVARRTDVVRRLRAARALVGHRGTRQGVTGARCRRSRLARARCLLVATGRLDRAVRSSPSSAGRVPPAHTVPGRHLADAQVEISVRHRGFCHTRTAGPRVDGRLRGAYCVPTSREERTPKRPVPGVLQQSTDIAPPGSVVAHRAVGWSCAEAGPRLTVTGVPDNLGKLSPDFREIGNW